MEISDGQFHEAPSVVQGSAPKRSIVVYAVFVALGGIIALGVIGYIYLSIQVRKPIALSEKRMFVVEKGESVQKIAEDLEKKGLVSRGFYFWLYVWSSNTARSLQAGVYAVEGSVSPKSIADMIVRGAVVRDTISVTIPEGFTMCDIEARLREAGLFAQEKKHFIDLTVGEYAAQYDVVRSAPAHASLEGYLFPDTYEFKKDVTMSAAADMMLANFAKKTNGAFENELARQGKTMHEIVTMASIIEKEVMTPDDMKLVSGVLWKRIALGMPLQVDASVIYAIGKNDITRDDLSIDSPYNTYTYAGLPKGPISNPGMNAIMAALYPTASDFLYYISKPTKETVFSRTLKEHNAAVEKYLK